MVARVRDTVGRGVTIKDQPSMDCTDSHCLVSYCTPVIREVLTGKKLVMVTWDISIHYSTLCGSMIVSNF